MIARQVFNQINFALKPFNDEFGFARSGSISNGFYRQNGSGAILLYWVQFDRYGFDSHFGSRFTIEIQIGNEDKLSSNLFKGRKRAYQLLGVENVEKLKLHNQFVVDSINSLKIPEDHIYWQMPVEVRESMIPHNNYLYNQRDDRWVLYRDALSVSNAVTLSVAFIHEIMRNIINLNEL